MVLTLNEMVKVTHGEDVTLQLTNGAQISGADLARRALADVGLITLIHPATGPVNLYQSRRRATWKQRQMAMAENPVCPWPDCHTPADECQVHHLTPWLLGGDTNPENLTMACKYHNGVNDDDPNAPPRRGRLERRPGEGIVWRPPWATPPEDG